MNKFYNISEGTLRRTAAVVLTLVAMLLYCINIHAYTIKDLYIYHNGGDCGGYNFYLHVFGDNSSLVNGSMEYLGDNVYKYSIDRNDVKGFRFYKADTQQGDPGNYSHCYTPSARCGSGSNFWGEDKTDLRYTCYHTNDGGWGLTPMWNLTVSDNGSTTYGGSGTSASPYVVYGPSGAKVRCNASKRDNVTAQYKWQSWGSATSWTDNKSTDDISIPSDQYGKKFQVKCTTRVYNNNVNSAERGMTNNLYYIASAYKRTAKAYYRLTVGGSTTLGTTGGTVKIGSGSASSSVEEIENYSTSTTFTATPAYGYVFDGWYDNSSATGTPLSTEKTYTVSFNSPTSSDQTVYAIFTYRSEPTLLLADSAKIYEGPKVVLSAYLKNWACDQTLTKRGFILCKTNDCTPTVTGSASDLKWEVTKASLEKSEMIVSDPISDLNASTKLEKETNYRYRAYVYSGIKNQYYYSETGTFRTREACHYAIGDTVYYTLDCNQPADRCELRFQTIGDIVDDMKSEDGVHDQWLVDDFLTKPIVINVVSGNYGDIANDEDREEKLKNINTSNGFSPTKAPSFRLIIRGQRDEENHVPVFKGGFNLLGSRYITFEDVKITRETDDASHSGSAVELGYYTNDGEANSRTVGCITNSGLIFKNCEIDATGFNCIHALGCDGILFENCIFTMEKSTFTPGSDDEKNNRDWGASIKLMNCKNIKFVRNSIKGSHSTTLWLQHVQNMLIMNNVFWNSNEYTTNVAVIRPMMFGLDSDAEWLAHKVTNLAIYYNTFFLANRDGSSNAQKLDFLRFGGPSDAYHSSQAGHKTYYDISNIEFRWNNCYSYDANIVNRNDNDEAFQGYTDDDQEATFKLNNFWSIAVADDPDNPSHESGFAFGSDTKHVNVKDLLCQTTATNPEGLIVKGEITGSGLNFGEKPDEDKSGLSYANNTYSDRLHSLVRPDASSSDKWTLGAYQQSAEKNVDVIIWTGEANSDWDNRNNWKTSDNEQLNCMHNLAANLTVVIPDASKVKNLPNIPAWNDPTRADETTGPYYSEKVEAGRYVIMEGMPATTKFAEFLDIKNGGALKGVENLNDGTMRYGEVTNIAVLGRSQWILVGTVVKKFNDGQSGSTGTVRNTKSKDYYIENHEPHVYMQHYRQSDKDILPDVPFTSLDTEVLAQTAFGVNIPDQYGPSKLKAKWYYRKSSDKSLQEDGDKPKTFTFTGHFVNESGLTTYTLTTSASLDNPTFNFVNNTYPANLDLTALVAANSGLKAKYYDYVNGAWVDVTGSEVTHILIKPQSGFVLYSTSLSSVTPAVSHYVGGSTVIDYNKRASADSHLKLSVINSSNLNSNALNIMYGTESLPKAFSHVLTVPEIYVPGEGDNMYSTFGIDDYSSCIPLGIRNKQDSKITIQFVLDENSGFESVVLEDRMNSTSYNLTDGEKPYFDKIVPGDCLGRFYLNINYAGEDEPDVPTSADGADGNSGNIGIYATGNTITVSAPNDMTLQQILVSDMAGRTYTLKPESANYSAHTLGISGGVYVITAVADKATETKKVIIK